MIVHRRKGVNSLSLVLVGVVLVPFVANGGLGTWVIVGSVWAVIVGVLVRRFRTRGRRADPPPWAVEATDDRSHRRFLG